MRKWVGDKEGMVNSGRQFTRFLVEGLFGMEVECSSSTGPVMPVTYMGEEAARSYAGQTMSYYFRHIEGSFGWRSETQYGLIQSNVGTKPPRDEAKYQEEFTVSMLTVRERQPTVSM